MKLRTVRIDDAYEVQALTQGHWTTLNRDQSIKEGVSEHLAKNSDWDMLTVLQLGPDGWKTLQEKLDAESSPHHDDAQVSLPFQPASFRDFMLNEKHVIDSSRGYVKRFMPAVFPLTQAIEKVTRKPFGMFRPHSLWYKQPIYYLSNHLNFGVSGDDILWPDYTEALDYELELGAVLAKPLFSASPQEAANAIGGFVVLNDLSARDVQKAEMDSGFGPQKAKHFASTVSSVLVTADEILPNIDDLNGSVSINGKEVARVNTRGMQFSMAEAIAFASKGEQLHPGELFGSGTIPGGSGMENGNWLARGDRLTLKIDQIGTLTNKIGS